MELVRPGMNIDFVGKRKWAYNFSLLTILVTVALFVWRGGPNYGVDFAGGTVVQFKLGKKQAVSEVREALNRFHIEGTHIQEFEEGGEAEYLIRIGKGSDVAITLGAFALTDREFSLTTIAALLTIVGYSLNDTIIIFDRIRENLRRTRKQDLAKLINDSVNQTLSRTLITSGTTLIVVVALFIFGGNVIHDFAFALMVGFVVGTYSTIYVASPILFLFERKKRTSETLK
jgi:preprotein translocase subunit SecF